LCISGNFIVKRLDYYYFIKKVRCHNRQIHKANILKGGKKKLNQAPFEVKRFRLFDKVKYEGEQYFIFARRSSGFFDIRKLDGTKVNKGSLSCKKITLIEKRKNLLWERMIAG
jgi:N6-L-threonylcarbamoyladenine synthase